MAGQHYPSTKAITTVLRELGFRARSRKVNGITQYADFRVRAETNSAGERLYVYAVLNSREVERTVLADRVSIESMTEALGCPWYVSERGSYVMLATVKLTEIPVAEDF